MLGRIIGGLAGRSIARRAGGADAGIAGTLIGVALPTIMRRFGPLGMVGAALGTYALRRFGERQAARVRPREPESPIHSI